MAGQVDDSCSDDGHHGDDNGNPEDKPSRSNPGNVDNIPENQVHM